MSVWHRMIVGSLHFGIPLLQRQAVNLLVKLSKQIIKSLIKQWLTISALFNLLPNMLIDLLESCQSSFDVLYAL